MSTQTTLSVEELRVAGNELFKSGKYDEAVEKYSDGLAVDPTNHLLLSNRSLALCSGGRFDEAVSDAKECVRLQPTFVKGYYRLATAYLQQGRQEEATKAVNEGLARDPKNPELKKLLRRKIDTQTQKEVQELTQTMQKARLDIQESRGRAQACHRERQRLDITRGQVQAAETTLYRAVGKAFILEEKKDILEYLNKEIQTNDDKMKAIGKHQAALDKKIVSLEADIKALVK